MRDTISHTEDPSSTPEPPREHASLQDYSGKFVIVIYDELPYVGHVLQDVGEEVQVSSMRQMGEKNLCGHKHQILFSIIRRMSMLSLQNLSEQPHATPS